MTSKMEITSGIAAARLSAWLNDSVKLRRLRPEMLPSALLFDMDGTLTRPMLDFPKIKREMGIGDQPILEALEALDPERRSEAQAVLHRFEERAAAESDLNPGCHELVRWIH